MIRIGLVGSASSRAEAFSRLVNVEQVVGNRARVVAIWSSTDAERTAEVARIGEIPEIARSIHHLADQVDAAIIVDRHGDLHAEHALPFLLDGKPVYTVPPLAIDLVDCRRMLTAARRSDAALSSFSALAVSAGTDALRAAIPVGVRLAQLAGPCDFGSPHGGPFHAAPRLIELALGLLGERVIALRAARVRGAVAVDLVWERDVIGMLGYVKDADPAFRASLFGPSGSVSREVVVDDDAVTAVLSRVVDMFESGRAPLGARRLLQPVVLVHAIVRSLDRDGDWIDVAAMLDAEVEALR